MRRTAVALYIAGSLLGLSFCQPALAIDNLFSNNLFPDDKSKPLFNDFNAGEQPSISNKQSPKEQEAQKQQVKALLAHDDEEMKREMQKVAGWLQEFSMRNQNRFPGVYGDSGTIERAAEVQLTELVGPNPYANASGAVEAGGLNGLSPGLSYYYNNDGTPVTNSPLANDEWTAELTADNAHRIQLSMDQSASDSELDTWRNDAPSTMQAAPGEICASGNGQGYLYVWGAGVDGRPIKDFNGKTYFLSAQTANNVEDQGQEAGY